MTTPKKDQAEKAAKPNRRGARKSPTGAEATTGRKERRLGETDRRREWHPPDFYRYPPVGTENIDKVEQVPGPVDARTPIAVCVDQINTSFIGVETALDEVGGAILSILAAHTDGAKNPENYEIDSPGSSDMASILNSFARRLDLIRGTLESYKTRIEL